MAEQVGTLLWEWRTAAGWSLGQLAQRAGVSKSALSRWESGLRQPRVPELEATLEALGATQAQRSLALARIEAPRALRLLRTPVKTSVLGTPPSAGDLLRALRQRGGWAQEQIALRLGVGQNTIARWERGERLPSSEQMQALCYALEAREEEVIALTTGRFAEAPAEIPTDHAQVLDILNALLYSSHTELSDLHYLLLERGLWQQAAKEERAYSLLARTYAEHAHHLSLYNRWEEVKTLATRALALSPKEGPAPNHILRAALKLAASEVYGGRRQAPERGLRLLQAWLPRASEPNYRAWILSDMGEYLAISGQRESAVALSWKALGITEQEREMRGIDHGRLLLLAGHPDKALEQMPTVSEQERGIFVYEAVTRCKAYLALGKPGEASAWLQRAYAVMETYNLRYNRPEADTLARRF